MQEEEKETQRIVLDAANPTVARLIEIQDQEGLSDAKFAKQHLNCVAATWSKIKNAKYHLDGDNHASQHAKLVGDLAALEDMLAARGDRVPPRVLDLTITRLGMSGLRRAFAEERDRLVWIGGTTGAGKSTLARAAAEAYADRVLFAEATETWRNSYLAACHGLLAALRVPELPGRTLAAETLLLRELADKPRIIIIDEAHYFGASSINLVKAVLNKTQSIVMLLAVPRLWDRMVKDADEEAAQLRSRTIAHVQVEGPAPSDAAALLAHHLGPAWSAASQAEQRNLARAAAAAGKRFGQLDTITRIAREIAARMKLEKQAALETDLTTKAIATVAALRA